MLVNSKMSEKTKRRDCDIVVDNSKIHGQVELVFQ